MVATAALVTRVATFQRVEVETAAAASRDKIPGTTPMGRGASITAGDDDTSTPSKGLEALCGTTCHTQNEISSSAVKDWRLESETAPPAATRGDVPLHASTIASSSFPSSMGGGGVSRGSGDVVALGVEVTRIEGDVVGATEVLREDVDVDDAAVDVDNEVVRAELATAVVATAVEPLFVVANLEVFVDEGAELVVGNAREVVAIRAVVDVAVNDVDALDVVVRDGVPVAIPLLAVDAAALECRVAAVVDDVVIGAAVVAGGVTLAVVSDVDGGKGVVDDADDVVRVAGLDDVVPILAVDGEEVAVVVRGVVVGEGGGGVVEGVCGEDEVVVCTGGRDVDETNAVDEEVLGAAGAEVVVRGGVVESATKVHRNENDFELPRASDEKRRRAPRNEENDGMAAGAVRKVPT